MTKPTNPEDPRIADLIAFYESQVKYAGEVEARYKAAAEAMRARASGWGGAIQVAGTALVGGISIATLIDVFPDGGLPDGTTALFVATCIAPIVIGLVMLLAGVLLLSRSFMMVGRPVVIQVEPDPKLEGDEFASVEEIFARFEEVNKRSLKEYVRFATTIDRELEVPIRRLHLR